MTNEMKKYNLRALREVYLGNATPIMVNADILLESEKGYAAFASKDLNIFTQSDLQTAALKAIKEIEEVQ